MTELIFGQPDIGLSIWYCKNHLSWFFLWKKISDCKNIWLSSSSESGQEQVLVGGWFRSSTVWDNQIHLIHTFLAAGQMCNIKLSYWQLCTTSGHSEVTYRYESKPAQCLAVSHALIFSDLQVLHGGCEAVRACMLHLHPVIQSNPWEDAAAAQGVCACCAKAGAGFCWGEGCAARLKRLSLQRMQGRKQREKGDPTSCSLIYINQSPLMSCTSDLCSVSL